MSANADTKDIQRSLLKLIMSNQMELRMNIHSIRDVWFTTKERKYILQKIISTFETTKSCYTKDMFEHHLDIEIEENSRAGYFVEWNYINGKESKGNCQALISLLINSENAKNLTEVLTESIKLLEEGDVNSAIKTIRTKSVFLGEEQEESPIISAVEYEDIETYIVDKRANPHKYKGIMTGFSKFDKKVGGLFPAELTMIAAVTGVGKSTFMKQIAVNVMKQGKNVLHITNEENKKQVRLKYNSLLTEIPYNHLKNPQDLSEEEFRLWKERMQAIKNDKTLGRIDIKEIPQFTDISLIERAYIDLEFKGLKPDVIIIDYLDHMKPVQQAFNENDEQAKVAADAKGLAISCNVPVISATQAATIAEAKQEKHKKFGKFDVYGSKRKVHASNTLIFVVQDSRDETQSKENGGTREEYECDWIWSVEIAKNRDGPQFSFACRQHVLIGKVEPIAQEEKQLECKKVLDEFNKIVKDVKEEKDEKLNIDIGELNDDLTPQELQVEQDSLDAAMKRLREIKNKKKNTV